MADHLTRSEENLMIDIVAFARQHISELQEQCRKGTAYPLATVANSLCDYFNSQKVEIEKINTPMLPDYEKYLRKERRFKRKNQFGRTRILNTAGSGLETFTIIMVLIFAWQQ